MNPQIKEYIAMADMAVKTIGGCCEVVLHDFNDKNHSVVYVANDTVTGTHIGDSFEVSAGKDADEKRGDGDFQINRYYYTQAGKLIKSSTSIIRRNGEAIGAVTINLDVTSVKNTISVLESFIPGCDEGMLGFGNMPKPSNMQDTVAQLIDSILDNRDASCMTRKQKMAVVEEMNSRGIFLMKGAIDTVSEKMGIAKVTIYSYLDIIKAKNNAD